MCVVVVESKEREWVNWSLDGRTMGQIVIHTQTHTHNTHLSLTSQLLFLRRNVQRLGTRGSHLAEKSLFIKSCLLQRVPKDSSRRLFNSFLSRTGSNCYLCQKRELSFSRNTSKKVSQQKRRVQCWNVTFLSLVINFSGSIRNKVWL